MSEKPRKGPVKSGIRRFDRYWFIDRFIPPLIIGLLLIVPEHLWTRKRVNELTTEISQVIKVQSSILQKARGNRNQLAAIKGSHNTVNNVQVDTPADIRKDPPEAPMILRRIGEGQALLVDLDRCQYKAGELEPILGKADRWAESTFKDLQAISEIAAQQFSKQGPPRGLQVDSRGCDSRSLGTHARVEDLIDNLRGVLAQLAGPR